MIPKKIEYKLRDKCEENKLAFKALIALLEYEENDRGKQNMNCKRIVEDYVEDKYNNEN